MHHPKKYNYHLQNISNKIFEQIFNIDISNLNGKSLFLYQNRIGENLLMAVLQNELSKLLNILKIKENSKKILSYIIRNSDLTQYNQYGFNSLMYFFINHEKISIYKKDIIYMLKQNDLFLLNEYNKNCFYYYIQFYNESITPNILNKKIEFYLFKKIELQHVNLLKFQEKYTQLKHKYDFLRLSKKITRNNFFTHSKKIKI